MFLMSDFCVELDLIFECLFCYTSISKFSDYSAGMHGVGTYGRGTCPTTIKLETSPVNPPEMTARNIQTILCYMLEKEKHIRFDIKGFIW